MERRRRGGKKKWREKGRGREGERKSGMKLRRKERKDKWETNGRRRKLRKEEREN